MRLLSQPPCKWRRQCRRQSRGKQGERVSLGDREKQRQFYAWAQSQLPPGVLLNTNPISPQWRHSGFATQLSFGAFPSCDLWLFTTLLFLWRCDLHQCFSKGATCDMCTHMHTHTLTHIYIRTYIHTYMAVSNFTEVSASAVPIHTHVKKWQAPLWKKV